MGSSGCRVLSVESSWIGSEALSLEMAKLSAMPLLLVDCSCDVAGMLVTICLASVVLTVLSSIELCGS